MEQSLVVFDLDDTLYLERDFARSGYKAAAQMVASRHGVVGFGEACLALLDAGNRDNIFNAALKQFGLEGDADLVAALVKRYRTHQPDIQLAPDASRYLASRRNHRHALVTDGIATTQEAKIEALGLNGVLDFIVCTGRLGAGFGKPHPLAFEMVELWARPQQAQLVYVADNLLKDFITPKARGWATVHIQRAHRIHQAPAPDGRFEPHAAITTLDDLDACLDAILSQPLPSARSPAEA